MIQFMKSKNDRYGEHERLKARGRVHTMGAGYLGHTRQNGRYSDLRGDMELCVEKMRSEEYDLLVFDELVYVLDYKFLDLAEVLAEIKAIREKQPHLHIIMTGRNAPADLVEAADLVTEMKEIKHPFHAGIYAQQGIEF